MRAIALACLLAFAAATSPARAEMLPIVCGEAAAIRAELARVGETPVQMGVSGRVLVEVWASPAGSFTVIFTLPGGPACVVLTGESWSASGRPS